MERMQERRNEERRVGKRERKKREKKRRIENIKCRKKWVRYNKQGNMGGKKEYEVIKFRENGKQV